MKKLEDYLIEAKNNKIDKTLQDNIKKLYDYYSPGLFSEEEMQTLSDYVNTSYDAINRYLYKGHDNVSDPDATANIENSVAILDTAFSETQSPIAYRVYLALSQRYRVEDFIVKEQYMFRGYVSTSLDYRNIMNTFTDYSMILQINIKKGQPAIFIDSLIPESQDNEVLLPRGSTIQLMSNAKTPDENLLDPNTGLPVTFLNCNLI